MVIAYFLYTVLVQSRPTGLASHSGLPVIHTKAQNSELSLVWPKHLTISDLFQFSNGFVKYYCWCKAPPAFCSSSGTPGFQASSLARSTHLRRVTPTAELRLVLYVYMTPSTSTHRSSLESIFSKLSSVVWNYGNLDCQHRRIVLTPRKLCLGARLVCHTPPNLATGESWGHCGLSIRAIRNVLCMSL